MLQLYYRYLNAQRENKNRPETPETNTKKETAAQASQRERIQTGTDMTGPTRDLCLETSNKYCKCFECNPLKTNKQTKTRKTGVLSFWSPLRGLAACL